MKTMQNLRLKRIYASAKSLFMHYGIRRISIEEICRDANVSKMTFYKYFRNKIELLKFILENMISEALAKYQQINHQPIAFSEKVRQTIQLKTEQANDLSQEFFKDIHRNADPEIKDFLNHKLQMISDVILQDYIQAQQDGDIRPDLKPEFIPYFLNHLMVMVEDEKLLRLYDSPKDLIVELTNFFFYGILSRNG